MTRQVRVIFIDDAEAAILELNKRVDAEIAKGTNNSQDQQLLKSIKQKVELIKANPAFGDKIRKDQCPKKYKNLTNLWRVNLSGYWRMLYTLATNEIEIVSFVIELADHPTYDKLFGYRKR